MHYIDDIPDDWRLFYVKSSADTFFDELGLASCLGDKNVFCAFFDWIKKMERGYVKTWRKVLDGGMLGEHKLWAFWSWCLLKATHKKAKQMVGFQEVILEPGQFVFGRKKAAKELKMSERNIRTCLSTLKTYRNLTIKATTKYTIVTVVNWALYQVEDNKTTSKVTNNRPASDQQVTTNKNIKTKKHKKRTKELSDSFDIFWKAYPRKKNKGQAEITWEKIKPNKELQKKILSAIEKQKNAKMIVRGDEFTPHPSTWLNAKGWENEIVINGKPQPEYPKTVTCKFCEGEHKYRLMYDGGGCDKCHERFYGYRPSDSTWKERCPGSDNEEIKAFTANVTANMGGKK